MAGGAEAAGGSGAAGAAGVGSGGAAGAGSGGASRGSSGGSWGRSKPAPLRMSELGEPLEQPSCDSSPVDAALMARKAQRRTAPSLQVS